MQKKSIEHAAVEEMDQIICLASTAYDEPPEQPYKDNCDHLIALEMEARLHLVLARHITAERFPWQIERSNDRTNHQDVALADRPHSAAEMSCRLAAIKTKRRKRELLSRKKGIPLYFVEIAALYELDAFERDVLMLLLIYSTSHTFKASLENSVFKEYVGRAGIEVGAILAILEPEFTNQIRCRSYFSIEARLIRNDILRGRNGRYDPTDSILDEYFSVHQRIVNFIMGDDNVYTQDMRCIEKVRSRVDIDKLILPGNTKEKIIERVSNYLQRTSHRSELNIASHLGYGTGMNCLFYGPSGTGKTMLAHGLASHFGMNLLLIHMGADHMYGRGLEEIVKYAFKEARLTNSIVFFDECDDVFKSDTYDSRLLLIEIEKADNITILATNRTIKLDPALDRRIQLKVHLGLPGAAERERIWRSLIPQGVQLSTDVNFGCLAEKYQFSGGLIKNTLLQAIDAGLRENESGAVVLTHAILESAAQIQWDQTFACDSIGRVYAPSRTIDSLSLSPRDKLHLKNLAACQSAGLLNASGMGTLIVTDAIAPAVEALEAVACACDCWIHTFVLSDLFCSEDANRSVRNPLTHELMKPIEQPFQVHHRSRSLTVLIDDTGKVAGFLGKQGKHEEVEKLFDRIAGSRKHVFLIVKGTPKGPLPKGMLRALRIGYPPEMAQINAWTEYMGQQQEGEDLVHTLVDRHPMHLNQIRTVCSEARIQCMIAYGTDSRMKDFVEEVIRGHRKQVPVLFGVR